MARQTLTALFLLTLLVATFSCSQQEGHPAPAIRDRDSVPMMVSYGVNTIISDSGVQKYRIVAERWEVNTAVSRQMWRFSKGLFLSEFNDRFEIIMSIQADTAYYYNKERLWELRGRVRVRNIEGLRYSSEELYWNQITHQLYSNVWSKLVTPERTLEGDRFRSDERMENYNVWNTNGSFVKGDMMKEDTTRNIPVIGNDSMPGLRDNSQPLPRRNYTPAPALSEAPKTADEIRAAQQ